MCNHKNFTVHAVVERLTEVNNDQAKSYNAKIEIACSDCGQPFKFKGVEMGFSYAKPVVINLEETKLQVQIEPLP